MNIQDRTAIPGDEQGVHDHAECRSVYNFGIRQVTGCQAACVSVDAPRSDIEGVIVGRNLMEPCIVELCAPPAQAVSGAAVNVLIGSEQEHDRKVNVRQFIAAVRKYTDMQQLDASVLREFVEKIYISEVYTPDENEPRIKVREIEIVYNFIGAFDFEDAREQSQAAQKEKKTGVA